LALPTPNYECVLAARPAGLICAAGTEAKVPRLGTSAPHDRSRGGMIEGPGVAHLGHARALRASPLVWRASRMRCSFSFLRRFFSPASHKWQNWQARPLVQTAVCRKAHGLQRPAACPADPTLGSPWEPSAGWLGGGGTGTAVAGAGALVQAVAGTSPWPGAAQPSHTPGCGPW